MSSNDFVSWGVFTWRGAQALSSVAIALSILAACTTKGPDPVDSKTAALCTAACKSAAACFETSTNGKQLLSDQIGCQKQCAVELDGKGYLAKDIATLIMTKLAEAEPSGGDKQCKFGLSGSLFDSDKYLVTVTDRPYLEKCVDSAVRACGTDNTSRDGWRSDCFREQYIYGSALRAEYEKCETLTPCDVFARCRGQAFDKRPLCVPWFGPSGTTCE